MFLLGSILQVTLLLINAIAVLSEDRFLARSTCPPYPAFGRTHELRSAVGWLSSSQPQNLNVGFQQPYDQNGYGAGQGEIGMKARLIDLISAVRTLMRSKCSFHSLRYVLNESIP